MPWYYAINNQRLGPVNDMEFARLARENIIHEDTLVWRYGMPDWKTYAEVANTLPALEVPPSMPVEPMSGERIASSVAENILSASSERLDYAGFWVRLVAKFVDLFILSTLVLIVANVMHRMPTMPVDPDFDDIKRFFIEMGALSRITLTIEFFYTCSFVWRFQATPGKLLLGLKIVNADGSPLGLGCIFFRFAAEMLNRMLLSFGYLSAAIDPEKRAMHDFLCNTRVIRKTRK